MSPSGRRPLGVTLIALLTWLSATLHVLLGVLLLAGVLRANGVTDGSAWISVIVGVIVYLVSFGLFGGSNVARILVTVSLVLSMLSAAILIIDDPRGPIEAPVVSAAAAALGLVMLYTGRANHFFGTR